MIRRVGVLGAIFRDPVLRTLSGAYLLFSIAEWSTWVAVIVVAYSRGGATEAAIVAFIELAPAALVAPAVAALGDRHARDRVLCATYAVQSALMAATALALAAGWSFIVVYALAAAVATMVTTSRPLHAALMPEVVASPDDLTAANVVGGMGESAGSLAGPLVAGVLIGLGGPTIVFGAGAVASLMAAVAVLQVVRRRTGAPRPSSAAAFHRGPAEPAAVAADDRRRLAAGWTELTAGLAAIGADRRLRSVVVLAACATFLVGAMDILYAVLALDLLGLGPGGVGFVGAIGGVGAIIGSIAGLLLVGRERLGVALAGSALLFGSAVAAISLLPTAPTAGLLLVGAGIGSGLTYVGAQTFIQRLAGDDVMSRVFGILHGLMMGATALGALAVPVVIGVVGDRAAFAVAGLSLPLVVALTARSIVRSTRVDAIRSAHLRLLRGVPMLAPLSGPVLERLAAGVVELSYGPDTVVIREGEVGDRFYVVVSGTLSVRIGDRDASPLGPGDGFGEIALLHDVPRTATVRAVEAVTLLAIDRAPFIEALTGQARSRSIALDLVDRRLAADVRA